MTDKYPGLIREAMVNSNSVEEFKSYIRNKVGEYQTTRTNYTNYINDLMFQRIREAYVYTEESTEIAARSAVVDQLTNLRYLLRENNVAGDADYITQAEELAPLIMYIKWRMTMLTKKRRTGLASMASLF